MAAHDRAPESRKRAYTLKKRAAQKAETRQRIVQAAVELHGTLGPAQTSLSRIAERAGVQRHTLYAHFPDERSLFLACSGLSLERDPLPDAAAWPDIADAATRLRAGLAAVYGWFERNETLLGCVTRDAEHHALTREMSELRFAPVFRLYVSTLGKDRPPAGRAMLQLALSFFTWRTLRREAGLGAEAAVEAMARAVESVSTVR